MDYGVTGLRHLRLNGLDKITDEAAVKFCCRNRGLQVLELCKCKKLTLAGIETIIKHLTCLKTININMIPKIKLAKMKETLGQKPWVQVLQFGTRSTNAKDNGLRVPLPPKKKQKVKKGKKKK